MLKMFSFDMNTRPETFVLLTHCIVDDTVSSHARPLSDAASVHGCPEYRKCFRACIHAKGGHFSVERDSRVCTVKFIWLILSTIRQNGDIVLETFEYCYFLYFSQGSVATNCRFGGKYDMILVANLPLGLKVKEFLKLVNISQSYEQILSGTFLGLVV